jgi:hypothetical protein
MVTDRVPTIMDFLFKRDEDGDPLPPSRCKDVDAAEKTQVRHR